MREEKSRREFLEKEKEEWQRRGLEFEVILKKVKSEVLESEKERTELTEKAELAEERVREAESRAAEAEERAARAESARTNVENGAASVTSESSNASNGSLFTAEQVQKQIDEKVHALSTELHAIYKKKHITKVAGLKKGFEAKTKEKTVELSTKVEALERQNEELQAKLDGTFSGVVPTSLTAVSDEQREEERKRLDEQAALIERQKAELAGRDSELRSQRQNFETVLADLERERVEKGELVAAVDEMLALQADMTVLNASVTEAAQTGGQAAAEDVLRKSIGMGALRPPSGLSRPGFGFGGPSGIGRPASGLARPVAGKSRMLSNIERMGGARFAE